MFGGGKAHTIASRFRVTCTTTKITPPIAAPKYSISSFVITRMASVRRTAISIGCSLSRSNPEMVKQILTEARSHKFFSDKPVTEADLETLYDLAKMAPSASNGCPMRITFVISPEGKERVLKASNPGNVEKIASAPVTMIIAYDTKFYDQYPQLAPHMPSPPNEASIPDAALEKIALRNSSLQAGFVMVAARSLGLDCGQCQDLRMKSSMICSTPALTGARTS